jgi:DNA-binding winged helix-turn-helix (wHTH) protein
VHLSTKAFDLLALLVVHRTRVLSKNETAGAAWPETFVVETNLASLIAEIREALNDDARIRGSFGLLIVWGTHSAER